MFISPQFNFYEKCHQYHIKSDINKGLEGTGAFYLLISSTHKKSCIINTNTNIKKISALKFSTTPSLEEGQTLQWPKEKRQQENSILQNITQKTKDRVTRTPPKTEG